MTNDILRLSEALTRDTERSQFRDTLARNLASNSDKIRASLRQSGEYRISTTKGDVVIRSKQKVA